ALRRRPSFFALRTLLRQLGGSTFERRLDSPPGSYLLLFRVPEGGEVVAGWSAGGPVTAVLPRPAVRLLDRDGRELPPGERADRLDLGGAVRYAALG
ncbi:MAG TPA: hypothetical protein VN783_01335, partial [Thermoanaerobaculia bacterium]|nr:hypothetical protein [Thermoanaerobaculia bacterium]